MSFYENFLRVCKAKNISPSKAAELSGLNKSVVSYWKKGASPKFETMQKIADALEVDVSELAQSGIDEKLEHIMRVSYNSNRLQADEMIFSSSAMELNAEGHKMLTRYLDYLKSVPEYQALNSAGKPSLYEAVYSENRAENARELAEQFKERAANYLKLSQKAEELAERLEAAHPSGADTIKVKELKYSGGGVGVPVPAGAKDAESTEDTDGDPFAAPVPAGG